MNAYTRLGAMVATSMVAMYALTYVNVYDSSHALFSEMRVYMVLVMGSAMAVIMLAFMRPMYPRPRANAGVAALSFAVFAIALWLVRSQAAIDDVSYMKAMIPHHSIAILTSERARIEDPRVRELADAIIEAQRREIDEMKAFIADIEDE